MHNQEQHPTWWHHCQQGPPWPSGQLANLDCTLQDLAPANFQQTRRTHHVAEARLGPVEGRLLRPWWHTSQACNGSSM